VCLAYQIFKDFAGPIATIIAASAAAYFAWQQMRIADVKLQYDLFDKRYPVFDATRKLLTFNVICPSNEDVQKFTLDTADASFLFNKDLASYLDEIRKRAVELQLLNSALEMLVGEQQNKAHAVILEKRLWFDDQVGGLTSKFEPFLKLDKRQRGVARHLERWKFWRRNESNDQTG